MLTVTLTGGGSDARVREDQGEGRKRMALVVFVLIADVHPGRLSR